MTSWSSIPHGRLCGRIGQGLATCLVAWHCPPFVKRDGHFERAIDLETITDAAKRLGVSRQRIYQLIAEEVLDYYQFGKRKMVHRADVTKLSEKRDRCQNQSRSK